MNSINSIVNCINSGFDSQFANFTRKFYGISQQVEKDNKIISYVGEEKIIFDDMFQVFAYHRITNQNVSIDYSKGFGTNGETTHSYTLKLLVFSTVIEINTLYQNIIQSLLKFEKYEIQINSININREEIYNNELGEVTNKLSLYNSLIEIDYTINITTDSNCFNICQ